MADKISTPPELVDTVQDDSPKKMELQPNREYSVKIIVRTLQHPIHLRMTGDEIKWLQFDLRHVERFIDLYSENHLYTINVADVIQVDCW